MSGLVQALVQKISEPTFATTDTNNTLERSTFTRGGKDWQGEKGICRCGP